MGLQIQVDGTTYEGFESIKFGRQIDGAAGTFSASVSASATTVMPFAVGDAIKILADRVTVLDGFVEKTAISYDKGKHSISIQGRDKTADFIDGCMETAPTVETTIGLVEFTQLVLGEMGLKAIKVNDDTGGADLLLSMEDSPDTKVSDTGHKYVEKYARKLGVLITTDGRGNLSLTRGQGVPTGASLNNVVGGTNNNIKAASFSQDHTKRFKQYIVKSQMKPEFAQLAADLGATASSYGVSEDTDASVRVGRVKILTGNTADSDGGAQTRAEWENFVSQTRSVTYTITVQGHSYAEGKPWQPNLLANINDDFTGVKTTMLTSKVAMSYDAKAGSVTTLTFVAANAYEMLEPSKVSSNKWPGLAQAIKAGETQ